MNKNLFFIFFMAVVISLVGCSTILGASDTQAQEELSINNNTIPTVNEYFPFLPNTVMEYYGEGNEFAQQQLFFEYIEDNKAQVKVMNPGTNMVRILEKKEGAIFEVYLEGEFYHIENMLNTKPQKSDIILKEPLEVGNSWGSASGNTKTITSIDMDLDTPYGQFKALEITTKFEEGRFQKEYFAKDIGFVGRIYVDGENEVKTMLQSIKEQPITQEILVFYPLKDATNNVYIKDTIEFTTNASIEKILERKLKNPPSEELGVALQPGVIINDIHLDRSNWVLNVDFNESLLKDLNVGSSYENEVLRSIVNTLGKFYDTESVYISVEKRPYESGHFAIGEGESFKVYTEGIEEFNR